MMIVDIKNGIEREHAHLLELLSFMRERDPSTQLVDPRHHDPMRIVTHDETWKAVPDHVLYATGVVERINRRMAPDLRAHYRTDIPKIPRTLTIGSDTVGHGDLPVLIAGPCTIDKRIDDIVGCLVRKHGVMHLRGGAWKPRTDPRSFSGYGRLAVSKMLESAVRHGADSVWFEVMDTEHIRIIWEESRKKYGHAHQHFRGTIGLWVGARTYNPELWHALGDQIDFPVMIKNGPRDGYRQTLDRVDHVLTGQRYYHLNGQIDQLISTKQVNQDLLICWRGTENKIPEGYRFNPGLAQIPSLQKRTWIPVGVDPSHMAGTMVDDLVLKVLKKALVFRPAFVLLEVYLDGGGGLCDAAQAVPLSRIPDVQNLIQEQCWLSQAEPLMASVARPCIGAAGQKKQAVTDRSYRSAGGWPTHRAD